MKPARKKPVVVWVTIASDEVQLFGEWQSWKPDGLPRDMRARRFVAIDSLPPKLRAAVRKACR